MQSTRRGSFSVHRSEKTPGSKYSSTSGLSPRGHLERQAEFHLGIVGESGCGKSVTAQSILRIVEDPGRIVGGEILLRRSDGSVVDLVKLKRDGREMRAIRGGDIG